MGNSVRLFAGLIAANAAAWVWALAAFHDKSMLLGTAFLAWSLGLRHAVDADHIAAIDNVTRRLLQTGTAPVSTGLFFALGHSAVVTLVAIAAAEAAPSVVDRLEQWSGIGTLLSVVFLLVIAAVNLALLRADGGGALARLCRPLFRLITRPWHMLFLGFLFGLGFDTATEIALLGLSATQGAQGLAVGSILVLPALFAAAMALVDTADAALMVRVYGRALVRPIYNRVITLASVAVAVGVAGIELAGFMVERWQPSDAFWGTMGLVVIGLFVAIWIGGAAFSRARRQEAGEAAAD